MIIIIIPPRQLLLAPLFTIICRRMKNASKSIQSHNMRCVGHAASHSILITLPSCPPALESFGEEGPSHAQLSFLANCSISLVSDTLRIFRPRYDQVSSFALKSEFFGE